LYTLYHIVFSVSVRQISYNYTFPEHPPLCNQTISQSGYWNHSLKQHLFSLSSRYCPHRTLPHHTSARAHTSTDNTHQSATGRFTYRANTRQTAVQRSVIFAEQFRIDLFYHFRRYLFCIPYPSIV